MNTVVPDSPDRPKDLFSAAVAEWRRGCLVCGRDACVGLLPGSKTVSAPLCKRHRRWAMASRRERIGKQAGRLKRLLLAWAKAHDISREEVLKWLGY